jgi:hypothetical protein
LSTLSLPSSDRKVIKSPSDTVILVEG